MIGSNAGSSSLDDEKSPYAEGYRAGKVALGADRPLRRRVSLGDFGYEVAPWKQGTLVLGFEQRHFTPDGEKGKSWIIFPDFLQEKIPKNASRGIDYWVRGWLSPEGMYGHMGGYRRQLVALEIYRQEPQPAAEPTLR